jgi:hypothetical protein
MPIYCENLQLVILKEKLIEKYQGGIEQFKIEFKWDEKVDHEDQELISLVSMVNSFPTPKGLHRDDKTMTLQDFVIVARYVNPALSWEVEWCDTNKVYILHKDCKLSSYYKAMELGNLSIDKIDELMTQTGKFPLIDIY